LNFECRLNSKSKFNGIRKKAKKLKLSAREEIRTPTISRHPLKVVRLPISPPGQGVLQLISLANILFFNNYSFLNTV